MRDCDNLTQVALAFLHFPMPCSMPISTSWDPYLGQPAPSQVTGYEYSSTCVSQLTIACVGNPFYNQSQQGSNPYPSIKSMVCCVRDNYDNNDYTFNDLYWVDYLFAQCVAMDYCLGNWVSREVCAQLVAQLDWGIFDQESSKGWGRVTMYWNMFEEWVIQYLAIGDGMLLEYCNGLWVTVSVLILLSANSWLGLCRCVNSVTKLLLLWRSSDLWRLESLTFNKRLIPIGWGSVNSP